MEEKKENIFDRVLKEKPAVHPDQGDYSDLYEAYSKRLFFGLSYGMDLKSLQAEQKVWSDYNFGPKTPDQPLQGVTEEIGELMESILCLVGANGRLNHAFLKNQQKIRGTADEHREAMIDAVGDIVVFLADFCTQIDTSLDNAVSSTWLKVRKRDFKKDSVRGGEGTLSNAQQERESKEGE